MKQSPPRNDFNSKAKNTSSGWGDEAPSNVKDEKERGLFLKFDANETLCSIQFILFLFFAQSDRVI